METTFWSKTFAQGREGAPRVEALQAVLPRYREKKVLSSFRVWEARGGAGPQQRHEVLLSRERCGDEDTLVAYRPDESLAMVFKMFDGTVAEGAGGAGEEQRRYLREVASVAACARCYQASWRGEEPEHGAVQARCGVCARASPSAAALLAHAKTHVRAQRARAKPAFAAALAKLLPHQFVCRVCQRRCGSVRALRLHLADHAGRGKFYCEMGDHPVP